MSSPLTSPPHKEFVVYLLAGALSTVFNIASFHLFLLSHMDYKLANLLTLLLTKLFAFVLNKVIVFKSKTAGIEALSKEFAGFFMGRICTGFLDYFGLILLVEVFSLPKRVSKCALIVIVIVLNYLLTRAAFKKPGISGEKIL
jgi:putative flippase GtrA